MTAAATSSNTTVPHTGPAGRMRSWSPVLFRTVAAAGSGFVLYLSFPPRTWWWLAPVAIAGLCLVIWRRPARAGFGYGLVFAMAWQLAYLKWLDDFLSPQFGLGPWLGLSAACAVLIALVVAGMAVVSRLPAAPVWMAMLVVGGEWLRERFPLNGFPWSKLAYSQADGVFLPLASVGGTALIGFAVALCGAGLALGVRVLLAWRAGDEGRDGGGEPADRRRPTGPVRSGAVTAVLALTLPTLAGAALTPTITGDQQDNAGPAGAPAAGGERLRVAIVQGDAPDVGIDLTYEHEAVWASHRRQLERLITDVRAGTRQRPDMVLLPETVAAVRPDGPTRELLRRYADELRRPLVIGARTASGDGSVRNSVLVVEPGEGETARYSKRELVPFSEYVPLRSIASWFTPFLNDTGDLTPGNRPAVLDTSRTRIGVAICYEVAYNWVLREAVDEGARLLTVPTKNAWFGRTEMSYQQLAMSRIRAVEHDRAVLNAAASGVSAVVRPDGTVARQTGLFRPATVVADVPLRSHVTLADRLGSAPEVTMLAGGLLAVLVTLGIRTRERLRRRGREHLAPR